MAQVHVTLCKLGVVGEVWEKELTWEQSFVSTFWDTLGSWGGLKTSSRRMQRMGSAFCSCLLWSGNRDHDGGWYLIWSTSEGHAERHPLSCTRADG